MLTMTLRWLICFSALWMLAETLAGATVSGKVELMNSRDPAVRKKKDYSGVVVWLEPVDKGAVPRPMAKPARMVQKDKTFSPHVLAVTVGSTVEFPNFDPIFHNAFSNYNGQIFDVGLYPPGSTRGVRFSRAGVVRVFCNIHANMSAVIVVLSTPYYDKSAETGYFEMPGVEPGEYVLHVFHERATPATLDGLARRVTVGREPLELPSITVSEGGYLAIPHMNKYGKEYPPAPDEGGMYPATRK